MVFIISYVLVILFGLLGLVLLGIRNERRRLRQDYEDAILALKIAAVARKFSRLRRVPPNAKD